MSSTPTPAETQNSTQSPAKVQSSAKSKHRNSSKSQRQSSDSQLSSTKKVSTGPFNPLSNKPLTPHQKRLHDWLMTATPEERYQYQLQQEGRIHGFANKAFHQGLSTQEHIDTVSRKTDRVETDLVTLKKHVEKELQKTQVRITSLGRAVSNCTDRITNLEGNYKKLELQAALYAKHLPEDLHEVTEQQNAIEEEKRRAEEEKRLAEEEKRRAEEKERVLLQEESRLSSKASQVVDVGA